MKKYICNSNSLFAYEYYSTAYGATVTAICCTAIYDEGDKDLCERRPAVYLCHYHNGNSLNEKFEEVYFPDYYSEDEVTAKFEELLKRSEAGESDEDLDEEFDAFYIDLVQNDQWCTKSDCIHTVLFADGSTPKDYIWSSDN